MEDLGRVDGQERAGATEDDGQQVEGHAAEDHLVRTHEGEALAHRLEARGAACDGGARRPEEREREERGRDQRGVDRVDRAHVRGGNDPAAGGRAGGEGERLVGGREGDRAGKDVALDECRQERHPGWALEGPGDGDEEDHPVEERERHGATPRRKEECRRAHERHDLRAHHDPAPVVAVGQRPPHQREGQGRHELDQADQPQQEGRARQGIHVPRDGGPEHHHRRRAAEAAHEVEPEARREHRVAGL